MVNISLTANLFEREIVSKQESGFILQPIRHADDIYIMIIPECTATSCLHLRLF